MSQPNSAPIESARARRASIPYIQDMVARVTGIPVLSMVSERRDLSVVNARHLAMWTAREANYTLNEIGRAFGDRDHTTVMHAVVRINRMATDDPEIRRLTLFFGDTVNDGA